MKISENWLREYVNPAITTQELCDQLTLAGLEVDGIEKVSGEFSGVVVGEIKEIQPHPDADKLRLCKVDVGDEVLDIVCGAPNVYMGMKAPVAKIGAVLPGNFRIKKSKLRGEPSNGMMCSEKELGISEGHGGLFDLPKELKVGDNIIDALKLNDVSIEVDLTPNRADCLSVKGISREVATLNNLQISEEKIEKIPSVISDVMQVEIANPEACPKYCARIIKGVNASVKTPLWLVEKLRRSGLRSISFIVDVTNYILLKHGQPMHAFDLDKLQEKILIRNAKENEALVLLDETKIKLSSDTLVIADTNKALAMAGIMGGLESSVTDKTTNILLESAFFSPKLLAGKARKYGLHTDSSHRFERGVDPNLCEQVIEEAASLIIEIAGGLPGSVVIEQNKDELPKPKTILLSHDKVERLLGFELTTNFIETTLKNLGMSISVCADRQWQVVPPSYRFDMEIEEDLIEELVRIFGYDKLPESMPGLPIKAVSITEKLSSINHLKSFFVCRGYHEAICYSFIDQKLDEAFFLKAGHQLQNPISEDMSVMRQGLLPGLLNTLKFNVSRSQSRVKLFEIGTVFNNYGSNVVEQTMVAGIYGGNTLPLNWKNNAEVSFFEVKGDIEQLLANKGELVFTALTDCKYLHPGQSASIILNGQDIGKLGVLHPAIAKAVQLKGKLPILFEINYELIKHNIPQEIKSISKFPSISRDIAVIVDESIKSEEIIHIAKQSVNDLYSEIRVFDVYSGENLPKNKKSIALNLILQSSSKTLIDEDIINITNSIVSNLSNKLGAVLRE